MKIISKIPKEFFGFLTVSVLIWLIINFSKKYETSIYYNVEPIGLPDNKILKKQPKLPLNILVKASGFELLSQSFSSKKIKIDVSKPLPLKKLNHYVLTANQFLKIQKQLPKGLKVQKIITDTIKLKIETLNTKKVPVIADVSINYKLGYSSSSTIKIQPDSILISAPEEQLATITNLKTEKTEVENVSKDFSKEISVVLPEHKNIKTNVKKVIVSSSVDRFTEGTLEIPITIKNLPDNLKINIFPKSANVIYKVGLKKFNLIKPESFTVECDYQEVIKNELSYLIPKLVNKPKEASSVRIVPEKIDFLIVK